MVHWTDSKIRIHAFCCVLALILDSLLHRQASQHGLALSLPSLLQSLGRMQEVTNLYPAKRGSRGRPRLETTLTEMDDTQQALYRLFTLDRYGQGRF